MQVLEVKIQVQGTQVRRSSEGIIHVPGSDNTGPGREILWPKLMSEEKETLLDKKKVNGTMLGSKFILSEIFIS